MLLGIGGVRAVRAWCAGDQAPQPEVFHTNEGHAGFQGVERIRECVAAGPASTRRSRCAARAPSSPRTLPCRRASTAFPRELVERHFGPTNPDYAAPKDLPLSRILAFGAEDDPAIFNMAHMGLRLAQRANGVSLLHGKVSREMFKELWPGFDASEVPIGSITNGVHALHLGGASDARPGGAGPVRPAPRIPARELSDEQLLGLRRQLRSALVDEVRRRLRDLLAAARRVSGRAALGRRRLRPGHPDDRLRTARAVVQAAHAHAVRPGAADRLLLHPSVRSSSSSPARRIPADDGGKELVQRIVRFADTEAVRHRMVFLPDYDIGMARFLYGGCDVWLNNPLRPLEACGTSGMKSALNGGLNLSIRDGWWDEMYDGQNGWAIPTADGVSDPVRRDNLEASALYDLIEHNVAPRFYERPTPDAVGGDGASHAVDAGPESARQPDAARLRHRALRTRRAIGSGCLGLRRRRREGTGDVAPAGVAGLAERGGYSRGRVRRG